MICCHCQKDIVDNVFKLFNNLYDDVEEYSHVDCYEKVIDKDGLTDEETLADLYYLYSCFSFPLDPTSACMTRSDFNNKMKKMNLFEQWSMQRRLSRKNRRILAHYNEESMNK